MSSNMQKLLREKFACRKQDEKEYDELGFHAKAKRPIWNSSHNCSTEKVSRKVFTWYDTTIEVLNNRDFHLIRGEIQTRSPKRDIKKIQGISFKVGDEVVKPCTVTRTHVHDGQHHLHFNCYLPYRDMLDITGVFTDLIEIKAPIR